jgi:hypothetical protein
MKATHFRAASTLAVAAWLSVGLPSLANGANEPTDAPVAPASQKPMEELQQLDEIWVHGQSLAKRIAKAENAFFFRYNKINRKGDYRVSCGYFTLERDSMVMRRNCTPAFLDPVSRPAMPTGAGARGGCGANRYFTDWGDRGYPCSIMEIAESRVSRLGMNPGVGRVSATPAQRKAYGTHVMKLILTDDELRTKAEALAVLYKEFDETQAQYRKAKVSAPPAKPKRNPRF